MTAGSKHTSFIYWQSTKIPFPCIWQAQKFHMVVGLSIHPQMDTTDDRLISIPSNLTEMSLSDMWPCEKKSLNIYSSSSSSSIWASVGNVSTVWFLQSTYYIILRRKFWQNMNYMLTCSSTVRVGYKCTFSNQIQLSQIKFKCIAFPDFN